MSNNEFILGKVTHFCEMSKKNFKVVDSENTAVTDTATLAGGKQLDVAPPSVKGVSKRYDVAEFENRAVGFPDGNIDRVAGI